MRICQCWDDGNLDDIRLCELLRRHRATASFNLNPGLMRAERYYGWHFRGSKPVWKVSAAEAPAVYQGFDIASHAFTHPHLPQLDDATLARELRDGRDRLEQLFGRAVTGFAYPFGDHDARVMAAVRAAGHVYARTCANADDVMACPDRMAQATSCHHQDPAFWSRFEQARAADGVFWFWGHSYEFVREEDWAEFHDKLERINAEPSARWARLPEVFAQPAG